MSCFIKGCACVMGVTFTLASASAQWTATVLHPDGNAASESLNVSAEHIVGAVDIGAFQLRAALWNAIPSDWTNLHPEGQADSSEALGVYNNQQVGYAAIDGDVHASLWSGSAGSWIDLHPPQAMFISAAYGTDGVQQVGEAMMGGFVKAGFWTGSAASWTSLHRDDLFAFSRAIGVRNGQQVGTAGFFDEHASLWTGAPESWVDLHPEGFAKSEAFDTDGIQQVGYVSPAPGFVMQASVWTGSAGSHVDLHPAGFAQGSVALGVDSGLQVGYVILDPPLTFGDSGYASVWFGTASSWVNLHEFLPPGEYETSKATGIAHDGDRVIVSGTAFQTTTHAARAVVWVLEANACPPDCDASGTLNIDDFICFQTLFALGDPAADCDASGQLNIDDFICFQTLFALGC